MFTLLFIKDEKKDLEKKTLSVGSIYGSQLDTIPG